MRNKSSKGASYRIKFTHIDTFTFHVEQIIGDYEINLVKENKTKKEKVKIVRTNEKLIKIYYNISKGILITNLKYNLFKRYGQLYCF